MRHSSYKSRLSLLETALLGVFHGDEKSVMQTARAMRKDMDFWYPLIVKGIEQTLPEADGMSVRDLIMADSSEDAANMLTYASAKQLAPRLTLGVIELRDSPIERLTYRGALIGLEQIASLLVVAGYSIMESVHDYEMLRESMIKRAQTIMEIAYAPVEAPVAAVTAPEKTSTPSHVLGIFPGFASPEPEMA